MRKSEARRPTILQKAFTGRLVPQDPTDEPASPACALKLPIAEKNRLNLESLPGFDKFGIISHLDGKLFCWFSGSMKTTLDLPDDLVHELKLRSVHERRKLKDVAAAALRRGLQYEPPAAELASDTLPDGIMLNERGFPVFRCGPNAPASRMTAEELIALEQKSIEREDLQRASLAP